ncbi:MAG: ComEA family DNA-binding protein [Pseudomonadota bacterium]
MPTFTYTPSLGPRPHPRHASCLSVLVLMLLASWLAQPAAAADDPQLNINTATAQALADALTGVGEVTAGKIVAYREAHGPFRDVEDLMLVQGIGARLLERNRQRLTVGEAAPASSVGSADQQVADTQQRR